jgi:hypothetical protein
VPLITAKRAGACSHCGGSIRKDEQAWFTTETGLRHPEDQCRLASGSAHRTNRRAGTCGNCKRHVPAGHGRLKHAGEEHRDGR